MSTSSAASSSATPEVGDKRRREGGSLDNDDKEEEEETKLAVDADDDMMMVMMPATSSSSRSSKSEKRPVHDGIAWQALEDGGNEPQSSERAANGGATSSLSSAFANNRNKRVKIVEKERMELTWRHIGTYGIDRLRNAENDQFQPTGPGYILAFELVGPLWRICNTKFGGDNNTTLKNCQLELNPPECCNDGSWLRYIHMDIKRDLSAFTVQLDSSGIVAVVSDKRAFDAHRLSLLTDIACAVKRDDANRCAVHTSEYWMYSSPVVLFWKPHCAESATVDYPFQVPGLTMVVDEKQPTNNGGAAAAAQQPVTTHERLKHWQGIHRFVITCRHDYACDCFHPFVLDATTTNKSHDNATYGIEMMASVAYERIPFLQLQRMNASSFASEDTRTTSLRDYPSMLVQLMLTWIMSAENDVERSCVQKMWQLVSSRHDRHDTQPLLSWTHRLPALLQYLFGTMPDGPEFVHPGLDDLPQYMWPTHAPMLDQFVQHLLLYVQSEVCDGSWTMRDMQAWCEMLKYWPQDLAKDMSNWFDARISLSLSLSTQQEQAYRNIWPIDTLAYVPHRKKTTTPTSTATGSSSSTIQPVRAIATVHAAATHAPVHHPPALPPVVARATPIQRPHHQQPLIAPLVPRQQQTQRATARTATLQ